jgi:NTE family protein
VRALILSGGGSKGSYQAGVTHKLILEEKQDYDMVCGISVGAINSAGLLKFSDIQKSQKWLEKLWLEQVDKTAVYKRRSIPSLIKTLWKKPIYDASPLHQLIKKNISQQELINSGKQLAVGAVCLDTGEYHYAAAEDEKIQDWIIASASYPMFMEAVEINGKLWADGQLKHVTPMRQAIKMGARELDIVLCSNFDDHPWTSNSKSHIPEQFIRTIDLMTCEIMSTDIKFLKLKNWMAEAGTPTDIPYNKIKARIIMPKFELTSNSLDFNKKEIKRMFEIGKDLDNSVVIEL